MVKRIVYRIALSIHMSRAAGYVSPSPQPSTTACGEARYLSWVWTFSTDGSPEEIAATAADHNLGIILKTHNGTDWMADQDSSPDAVSGPKQVSVLAEYIEARRVPLHAYAVVKGIDPKREVEMAAEVLAAGALSRPRTTRAVQRRIVHDISPNAV